MFKMMEHNFKDFVIRDINSTSLLHYQHQWEMELMKTDNIEVPKVDEKWVNTMENIVLHLKLMRGMRGALLAYEVKNHV